MAAIAAVTVTVHRKLSRVWPRVEFPSDFDEGLVANDLIPNKSNIQTGIGVILHLGGSVSSGEKTTVRM